MKRFEWEHWNRGTCSASGRSTVLFSSFGYWQSIKKQWSFVISSLFKFISKNKIKYAHLFVTISLPKSTEENDIEYKAKNQSIKEAKADNDFAWFGCKNFRKLHQWPGFETLNKQIFNNSGFSSPIIQIPSSELW